MEYTLPPARAGAGHSDMWLSLLLLTLALCGAHALLLGLSSLQRTFPWPAAATLPLRPALAMATPVPRPLVFPPMPRLTI